MKKLFLTLIFVLFLSSCNFPQNADLSQDPVVQTRVAVLLTQGAVTEPVMEETQELSRTYPFEDTTSQKSTDLPTLDDPTVITNSTSEEATPAPQTQTPLPSTEPWSGTPDFQVNFSNGSYWDFENDYLLSKTMNGQLEFTSKGTPWWSSWYTTSPEQKDGYYETTFTMPNCSGSDRFGLVIRWSNTNQFYYLGVTCDGTWGFSYYNESNSTIDLVTYTSTDALNKPTESNRIGILALNNDFEFYINGQKVGSVTHDAVNNGGTFGFISRSAGTQNFKTLIDKLDYWSN